MQKLGVSLNGVKPSIEVKGGGNRRTPRRRELGLEESHSAAHDLIQMHRLELWRRHPGEITEAADDHLQIGELCQQRGSALAKDFLKLSRRFCGGGGFRIQEFGFALCRLLVVGAKQVFHRDLQREKRILELVRQAAGQLPPCRYPFGLHQALTLFHQFLCHTIERLRQLPDLIRRASLNAGLPVALSHFPCRHGEPLHRTGNPCGGPDAEQET